MNLFVQMKSSLTGHLRPIQLDQRLVPIQQEQEHPVQLKRVKEKKARSQHKSFTSKHSQAKKKLKLNISLKKRI